MREKPRKLANERQPRGRAAPRAPSTSGATAHRGRRERFPFLPFDRTAGGPGRPEPPAASTRLSPRSEPSNGDRQHPKPLAALPTSTCETGTQTQPNTGLDLTTPDAAQSVAGAPLCLLSGLAAQAHVGLAENA